MTELEKLGIKIGHYTNLDGLTGATVIIPDNGADIGIDVRGSDTGSINIPAYEIKGADKTVEAIVLTGGSTAGLECSIGVMDYLNSPSVVGAVIYDRKIGKDERPHLKDGFEMAKNSSYTNLEQGNVGVGTGATTGKWIYKNRLKGGFGISIKEISNNVYIGAFVVINSVGDVINPVTKDFYSESGKYNFNNYYNKNFGNNHIERGTNTTLAVIVTNVEMSREELIKVSELAQDGMARAVYPVHTNWDGDVIFSISPHCKNRIKLNLSSFDLVNYIGITASDVLADAINNGIKNAKSIGDFPSYTDLKNTNH
jgi:similar to unknown protein. putative transmembrane protein